MYECICVCCMYISMYMYVYTVLKLFTCAANASTSNLSYVYVCMYVCVKLAELLVATAKKEGVSCHMDFAIKVSMVGIYLGHCTIQYLHLVTYIHTLVFSRFNSTLISFTISTR